MRAKHVLEQRIADLVGGHVNATVIYRDAPDAELLLSDGRRVGLEVVSTVPNDWAQAQRFMLEQLRPVIESELSSRGLCCFVQFGIEVPEHFPIEERKPSPKERRARNNWRETLPTKIADVASQGPANLGRVELEALGITRLVSLVVQDSDRALALPSYRWSSGNEETLVERLLAAKADKLDSYRRGNPQLTEFWLAMGPFGPGTPEDGFMMLFERKYSTPFKRVFLVNTGEPSQVWDVTPDSSP